MIGVLLIDDHSVVRAGLAHLLASADDIEVVGQADSGTDGIALAAELEPDVVLLDMSMPGLDGVETARRLLAARPDTHIVVLTSYSDQERLVDAFDAGVLGYLLKDLDPDELLRGVRAAARGGSPLDPRVAPTLLAVRAPREERGVQLTAREREILGLVVDGLLNKQIARRLGISEATVKTHLTRVFQRVGVSDRTQAALWAMRNGITGVSHGS